MRTESVAFFSVECGEKVTSALCAAIWEVKGRLVNIVAK